MFKFKLRPDALRFSIAALITGATALVAVGGAAAAPTSSSTVTVVNTSTSPVPIAGTVRITGTPTVNLGDNTVHVGNDDANPVNVRSHDEASRQVV